MKIKKLINNFNEIFFNKSNPDLYQRIILYFDFDSFEIYYWKRYFELLFTYIRSNNISSEK